MNFIKLTEVGTEGSIWINMDLVVRFGISSNGNYTTLYYEGKAYDCVKDTPEEIILKMRQNEQ